MFSLIRRNGSPAWTSLFDEMFEDPAATGAHWLPAVDFVETPESYQAQVELPGIDPGKIELELLDGNLAIHGEKTVERKEEGKSWHRAERRHGSFRRVLALPDNVDAGNVRAEARHGVLTITLPKREEAKARRIRVKPS